MRVVDSIAAIREQVADQAGKQLTLRGISIWMNEAVRVMAMNPEVGGQHVELALAEGSRQSLRAIDPAIPWVRLYALEYNLPTGRAINQVDMTALGSASTDWRSADPVDTVEEYALIPGSPLAFDVYPPVAAGTLVQGFAGVTPAPTCVLNSTGTALVDPAEELPVPEAFAVAVCDYVAMRYYLRNSADPNSVARAAAHRDAFTQLAGIALSGTRGAKP